MSITKGKIIRSILWKMLESSGSQLVTFVVTLVLARLVSPTEYGIVSLVVVFTSIAQTFIEGGFSTALIQKSGADDLDFSSVTVFSLLASLVLYSILFLASPAVALFYKEPMLTPVMRTLALMLPLAAYNSVQVAYGTKAFQFGNLFLATMLASLVSGVLGITVAVLGYGVWALVLQQISSALVKCIVLVLVLKWRPGLQISWERLRSLFSFGGNVLAGNLLVSLFLNIRSLIVGRVYDASVLGLLNRGKSFSSTIMTAINSSLQTVMLPAFSEMQDSVAAVKHGLRRSVRTSSFIVFPLMFGLAAASRQVVSILLGSAWAGCVPYLQLFAIGYVFNPIQTLSAQALRGLGHSSTTLRIEAWRKTAEFVFLILSVPFGPVAIVATAIASAIAGCIVAMPYNNKILKYEVREQLMDLSFPLFASMATFAAMWAASLLVEGDIPTLVLECIAGVGTYLTLAYVTKQEPLNDILGVLGALMRRA